MKSIVLASRNEHKIEELRATLSSLDIDIKSTLDFPQLEEVEEDKSTLEGNAIKKAFYVYNETSLPSLADDSGLEVEALNGRPGVYSARFAGESATDKDNIEKLLEEMAGVPIMDRKAQFRTVVAFVTRKGTYTFEGVCKGEILKTSSGDKGFGYDPIFRPLEYEETFAELDPAIKNSISHRGKAIKEFHDWMLSS